MVQSKTLDSERRLWQAVRERDARRDGTFVYAVRSTGVYCCPSCPSRRPKRERVLFFASPEVAERSGFRACRRCRPRNAPHSIESGVISRICRMIEAQAEESPRLSALAAAAGMGPFHLQRTFRRVVGVTPRGYAAAVRLRRLKSQLRKGDDVTTAMYEAGYSSPSRLYENSPAQMGMTPATYGHGGRGMDIGYTVTSSSLGRLLVAGTERGVSAIYLGDADAPLAASLRREYPEARIRRNPARVSRWVRQLVRHLSGKRPHLQLPLDVQATAFQRRVWEALQTIPAGRTRSYHDVSRQIGQPRATRAVARACATNPVSIVIPCHRVVRKDGGLGGYRWGLARKQALLEREKSFRKLSKTGRAKKKLGAFARRAKAAKRGLVRQEKQFRRTPQSAPVKA